MAGSRTENSRNTPRAGNQDVHEDFQNIDGRSALKKRGYPRLSLVLPF